MVVRGEGCWSCGDGGEDKKNDAMMSQHKLHTREREEGVGDPKRRRRSSVSSFFGIMTYCLLMA